MPKKKNASPEEEKMHTIFAIIFREEMEVFVNSTAEKNLWKTYDGHYRGRFTSTRERFSRSVAGNFKPECYALDRFWGTKSDGLPYRIAWSKLLSEAGYKLVLEETMRPMINDSFPDMEKEYERITQSSLVELLSPEKDVAAKYHTTKEQMNKVHSDVYRIDVKTDEETYRFVKEKAAKHGISMNELIVRSVRSSERIEVDTRVLENVLRRMDELMVVLQEIFVSILTAGRYKSKHVKDLDDAIKRMKMDNDAVKREVIQLCKKLKKQ